MIADGSGSRTLDIAGSVDNASWRPPDGTELVFRGQPGGPNSSSGLFAIRPDGTGLRPLTSVPEDASLGYQSTPIPDGRRIAYTSWNAISTFLRQGIDTCCSLDSPCVHLLETATGGDRAPNECRRRSGGRRVLPNGHLLAYQVWSMTVVSDWPSLRRMGVAPQDARNEASHALERRLTSRALRLLARWVASDRRLPN